MKHSYSRRNVLALAGAFAVNSALSQTSPYPNRPITLVLPFPAGGATDVIARMVAEKLQARLGQPVVVDNRPGGNTLIATNYVMSQRPDGHVLYFMSSTVIEQPALRPTVARFDPLADLTPISYLGKLDFVLVVNPSLPVRNVGEFLQLARTRPNGLSMAVISLGAADHLAGELIAQRAGVNLLHVPYKGSAPALADVAAGVVDARITDIASARPFIDSGRLRVIASAELKRPAGSSLETISETVPGVDVPVWFAFTGPKGMPPALVQNLHRHLAAIVQMPDVQEKFRVLYIEPVALGPDELSAAIRKRSGDVQQIVRDRGLKLDN